MTSPLLHNVKFGAYTELWAGLSDDVKAVDSGIYVIIWGRWHASLHKDLLKALKSAEGGTGEAARFRDWCEGQRKAYF